MRIGNMIYDLFARTYVMGILNVTPDSFYDGGRFLSITIAVDHAKKMVDEGADFIDVGGLSTRPGSEPITDEEEIERVVPVIEKLAKEISVPISIDTYRAGVARRALDAGAMLVNDISALRFDPDLAFLVAERRCPVVLMHIKGTPRDMQVDPYYDDVVAEIKSYLKERSEFAQKAGIAWEQIILDPGIGFGKRVTDNLVILKFLRVLTEPGYPVLVGVSRKSFIGKTLDLPLEERLEGSLAAAAVAICNGASILRVHDVKQTVRVARLIDAINQAG